MSITDELRRYISGPAKSGISHICEKAIANIADRIDAEHERIVRETGEEIVRDVRREWVRLPIDADGVPWHIGDVTESGQEVKAMGLNRHGWSFVGIVNEIDPAIHHHHQPDTWERIIRDAIGEGMARQRNNDSGECCERANPMNNDALVARCRALAGDAS